MLLILEECRPYRSNGLCSVELDIRLDDAESHLNISCRKCVGQCGSLGIWPQATRVHKVNGVTSGMKTCAKVLFFAPRHSRPRRRTPDKARISP